MCQPPREYAKLLIKEYDLWKLQLHRNQCYLGRCVIILNRHLEDILEISDVERDELFVIGNKLKHALQECFSPDLFNYSSLGNEVRHVHFHVTPRYERSVEFGGITFTDARWGHNPSPYDKNFTVPDQVHEQLISLINSRV